MLIVIYFLCEFKAGVNLPFSLFKKMYERCINDDFSVAFVSFCRNWQENSELYNFWIKNKKWKIQHRYNSVRVPFSFKNEEITPALFQKDSVIFRKKNKKTKIYQTQWKILQNGIEFQAFI